MKKGFLISAFVLVAAAIGFIVYALGHPELSFPWNNQIDIGIFLCFLELCLQREWISYEAELRYDAGLDDEKTLFAVYRLQP